jgi:hypothetical protein
MSQDEGDGRGGKGGGGRKEEEKRKGGEGRKRKEGKEGEGRRKIEEEEKEEEKERNKEEEKGGRGGGRGGERGGERQESRAYFGPLFLHSGSGDHLETTEPLTTDTSLCCAHHCVCGFEGLDFFSAEEQRIMVMRWQVLDQGFEPVEKQIIQHCCQR